MTLLEIVVALTIAAVVLAGAHAIVGSLAAQASLLDDTDRADAIAGNGERLLRAFALDARAGVEPSATFAGQATAVAWDSWCAVPNGWKERCRVNAELVHHLGDEGTELRLTTSVGDSLVVLHAPSSARLMFLDDARLGGAWVAAWGPATARPVAIGVLSSADTLILATARSVR